MQRRRQRQRRRRWRRRRQCTTVVDVLALLHRDSDCAVDVRAAVQSTIPPSERVELRERASGADATLARWRTAGREVAVRLKRGVERGEEGGGVLEGGIGAMT